MAEVKLKTTIETPDGKLDVIPPSEEDPLKTKDRMTCNLILHHQHLGSNTVSAEPRYSSLLETFDVEPLCRRLNISEEWQKINLGHILKDQVGVIVFESWVGKHNHVMPTDEEKELFAKQVIRIKLPGGSVLRVVPGGFQKFEVEGNAALIRFKCDVGDCRGYIWIFPR